MLALTLGQFISIFLGSTIYVGRSALAVMLTLDLNIWETLLSVCSGGIISSFLFSYLFDGLIHWFRNYLDKKNPDRRKGKKKFTRWNRFIIKAKRNFGVAGIAAVSTLVLSIPLGTFLALRFFGGKTKVFLWFSTFTVFWTLVIFSVMGGWNN